MRRLSAAAAAFATGAALVGFAPAARAAAGQTIAVWEMNEPAGAAVMADTSGHGIDGTIGSAVGAGATFAGDRGFRFPFTRPNTPPAQPERLVVVDDSRLNPRTRDFAVTVRMRTTHSFGNIIQKGQSGALGGYFKFQAPNGVVTCLFRGSAGSRTAGSGRALNDGEWHTIRCERTSAGVTMTVDDVVTGRRLGPTGTISNTRPLTIAGKLSCDQVAITCDYFAGDIDRVVIEAG